jgi:hypothetical protein
VKLAKTFAANVGCKGKEHFRRPLHLFIDIVMATPFIFLVWFVWAHRLWLWCYILADSVLKKVPPRQFHTYSTISGLHPPALFLGPPTSPFPNVFSPRFILCPYGQMVFASLALLVGWSLRDPHVSSLSAPRLCMMGPLRSICHLMFLSYTAPLNI